MKALAYTVGTSVFYPRRGVFRIVSIGASSLLLDDKRTYYELHPVFSMGGGIIYTPCNSSAFFRPILSEQEARGYLEAFPGLKPEVFRSKKTSEIDAHYGELLESDDPGDTLLLIKEILMKEKDQSAHSKRLRLIDQQYLRLALLPLCEEFAAALHTQPEKIKRQIYDAMQE